MKIATDHGFPKGTMPTDDAFDLFKNERDYLAQVGNNKTSVAAMDWAAAEIERLTGEASHLTDAVIPALRQEIEGLRAALLAQEEADAANQGRVGYDKWQALEDKAKELRLAALGHQQSTPQKEPK